MLLYWVSELLTLFWYNRALSLSLQLGAVVETQWKTVRLELEMVHH